MGNSKISVIIPMRNEEKYIGKCLDSILDSDYENGNLEILIIDSISEDKSAEIVCTYQLEFPNIKLFKNKNIFTPFAFNIGISNSTGNYIFIVSAHCEYDNDYFSMLVKYAEKLDADAVGAVSKTVILNITKTSLAIKEVLSHKFGVGNSYFRIGANSIKEVDAISGCYHKSVFKKYGAYNEKLIRNQDIELNKRIKNGGGKLYLIPYTSYSYYVREHFTDLAKNNYSNGFWNMLTAYYTKSFTSLSLRHFIPLLFILSLLVPLITSIVYPSFIWVAVVSLFSYYLLIISTSAMINFKKRTGNFIHLIICFSVLHLSYGAGSITGGISVLYKFFINKMNLLLDMKLRKK